jgi:hypothetical protein
MCETIINSITIILSVIIGAVITYFFTYLLEIRREKREMKKYLRHNAVKITYYIQNIKFACQMITKTLETDFTEKEDEFINETKKTLYANVERIYPILPEFNTFLFEYLPKLTNDEVYNGYEKSVEIIEKLYCDTRPTTFRFDEVTRNMLTVLQKSKGYFTDTNKFLKEEEKEFMATIKK